MNEFRIEAVLEACGLVSASIRQKRDDAYAKIARRKMRRWFFRPASYEEALKSTKRDNRMIEIMSGRQEVHVEEIAAYARALKGDGKTVVRLSPEQFFWIAGHYEKAWASIHSRRTCN